MSLAPLQTDAALEGLGDGSADPTGVGPLDGSSESVGAGGLESVGLGSTRLDAVGATLGSALGTWLGAIEPGGGVVGVPSPQPDSTSKPTMRNVESRTVPAVRGRMGVTGQA